MKSRVFRFDDGKYEVYYSEESYTVKAQRYREPWRELTGDNLVYHMLSRIDFLESHIQTLEAKLADNTPF